METPDTLHRTLRHYGTMVRTPKRVKNSQNFQNTIKKKYWGFNPNTLIFSFWEIQPIKIITKKFIFPCITPNFTNTLYPLGYYQMLLQHLNINKGEDSTDQPHKLIYPS